MSESSFTRHGPCDQCGSSDAVGWYSDGHGVCFSCGHYYPSSKRTEQRSNKKKAKKPMKLTPVTSVFRGIPKRGLPKEAIEKFQIDVNMDKEVDVGHRYPYFKNGIHVANKVRRRRKKAFFWEGATDDVELYGQSLFPAGSAKAVTVVEGELDAPSAWLLLGSRYPVVSVSSTGSAVDDCTRNFEYLNSFNEVVICFDKDEAKVRPDGTVFYPGQEAAQKVAELFAPGKCRILTLEKGRDPNEYLQKGVTPKEFVSEWWKAPRYTPDGLVFGHELWDDIMNSPEPYCVETPFHGLNQLIYGLRLGEMVTVTADQKIGKTTLFKAFEYALLQNEELKEKGYGVGFMHLEEPKKDLAVGLMGQHAEKRFELPDTVKTEEELREAYDAVVNSSRVVVWDHFGSNSVDAVVNKIRHMSALGCKYIFLDHFSILASDQADDERKKLDEIATKLKTLTVELDICLVGVIHQNREGKIRGTAAFEQLSNIVIRLERNKEDPDEWRRNVTEVIVQENRFSGRTGPATFLFYDDTTGCFSELDDLAADKFIEGLSINDSDLTF